MKYKLLIGIIMVLSLSLVSGALWKDDPEDCPNNYMAQTCSGSDLVCGYSGGVTYCYDMSTLNPPSSDEINSAGDTYQSSFAGGFLVDCYAYDGSEPHCDNSGGLWCNRNITCYNVGRKTNCTKDVWADSTCDICRDDGNDYFYCDGSYTDADGCEFRVGTSCGDGTGTLDSSETCFSATQGNCTRSGDNLDCNDDDSDDNEITCNGADGCEIDDGSACTISGLAGIYDGCSGGAGNCVVADQDIAVTGHIVNWSGSNPMLWLWQFGTGDVVNFTTANNQSFTINNTDVSLGRNILRFFTDVVLDNIKALWLTITGNVQITKQLNVTEGVTAQNFTTRDNTICNETVCFTLDELNETGGAGMDYTNLGLTNITNNWLKTQNFSGNITLDGGQINLNNNATIGREGTETKIWISETGNVITKFGS